LGGAATPALATEANPQIDYDGFLALTMELVETREAHRLNWDEFSTRMQEGKAILLDTRSAAAFAAGHIEGAINLPFSDFTDEKLLKVLGPDTDRPIFIYCNNNFSDDREPVTVKRVELALNIPTFINLHGYGYTNVWELADVLATDDPRMDWVENELALLQ
jgi:hypothetical protein